MADGKRRARAVVVALLVVVAAVVLLTLRCVTAGDDDETRRGGVAGDADAVADAMPQEPASGAADSRRAGDGVASRRHRTQRRHAPSETDASQQNALSPSENATRPAAANPSVRLSPYGRFTLVGDADADTQPGRGFGQSVAIDGDVAVIAAPYSKVGTVRCGVAYVYERRDGTWTQTARLDSPRPDLPGFGRRVAVAGKRVLVFGDVAVGVNAPVFRSYVRDGDGAWQIEQEVRIGEPMRWDAVARGDTVAVSVGGAVLIWRLAAGVWTQVQRIEAPNDGRPAGRFGIWLSLDGDALAVHSDARSGEQGLATYVFRRASADASFAAAPEATLALTASGKVFGTLARRGTALVWTSEGGRLTIDERTENGWTRTTAPGLRNGSFAPLHGAHGMAADGDRFVAVEVEPAAFAVLVHRDGRWCRAGIAAAPPPQDIQPGNALWHPNVAMSGSTVVAGTNWTSDGTGRAWLFDVTDDDLARATKVETEPR